LYYFLRDCIANKTKVDNLIIFSDMVIGDGGIGGWDTTSSAVSGVRWKAESPVLGTFQIWSERIFDQITGQTRGYDEIIKAVEAFVL